MTSWACRVSWKELCTTPRVLSTGNSGDFPPQSQGVVCFALFSSHAIVMFVVRANFVGKKKGKKLTKKSYRKQLLNKSREISYKKPDMRPVPVFSDYLVKLVIQTSGAI